MPLATIYIEETGPASCTLSAKDVRDRQHVQRLLLQALFPMIEAGKKEVQAPEEKLTLLRNSLYSLGAKDTLSAQKLLIMCLFRLADEQEEKRIFSPESMTNVIL